MLAPPRSRAGFTLVELMTVVAIIGILAAIAVPTFIKQVHKTKRAEANVVLAGIGAAELAFEPAHDAYVGGGVNPTTSPGKHARHFDDTMAGWADLGFKPSGEVRCSYKVDVLGSNEWFEATAYCDVDANGDVATVTFVGPRTGQVGTWQDPFPTFF